MSLARAQRTGVRSAGRKYMRVGQNSETRFEPFCRQQNGALVIPQAPSAGGICFRWEFARR